MDVDERDFDATDTRLERAQIAAEAFRAAFRAVRDSDIATPIECANAMLTTAVAAAFASSGCDGDDVAAVNACVSEVRSVVCRHFDALHKKKAAGA